MRGKKVGGKKKVKAEIPPDLTLRKIVEIWGNFKYGRKIDLDKVQYDESKVPAWLMEKVIDPTPALVPFNELDPNKHGAKYVARRIRRAEIKKTKLSFKTRTI